MNWWQRIIFVGSSIWPCYCIWMLTIHNFWLGYFINHHTYINFCQSTYSPRWSLSNSLSINFCQSTLLAANYFCWDHSFENRPSQVIGLWVRWVDPDWPGSKKKQLFCSWCLISNNKNNWRFQIYNSHWLPFLSCERQFSQPINEQLL